MNRLACIERRFVGPLGKRELVTQYDRRYELTDVTELHARALPLQNVSRSIDKCSAMVNYGDQRVPEMRLPCPGLPDAPTAGSARLSIRKGAFPSNGSSRDIGPRCA